MDDKTKPVVDTTTVKADAGTGVSSDSEVFTREHVTKLVKERDDAKKAAKTFEKQMAELVDFKTKIEAERMTEAEKTAAKLVDLDKYKAQATEYERAITAVLEAKMSQIPDDRKSLIPDVLTPAQKLEYIAKNEAHLLTATPTGTAGMYQGTGTQTPKIPASEKMTTTDLEIARKMGINPEKAVQYASKYRKAGGFLGLRKSMVENEG